MINSGVMMRYMGRKAIMTAILASAFGAGSAWAGEEATITEFPTPSAASLPQGVDIGQNGEVWYAETSVGKIALLRSNHSTSEFTLANGGQPIIVKVAADGIWFTDGPSHAIGHLNPATGNIVEYAIPSGASPLFLQIGPDGSKWFSKTTGVGRLSPNGVITEWDVTLEHPDDNIEQISLDPWGSLWFVERNFDGAGAAGTNKVRRLDPSTDVISTYLVPTFGGNPAGVRANANGTVWVAEYFANAFALLNPNVAPHTDELVQPNSAATGGNTIQAGRTNSNSGNGAATTVNPATHTVNPVVTLGWVEYHIPTANAQAEDMRVDHHGRLWFEEDSGLLGTLDWQTATFTEYAIPSANSGYFNIALDQDVGRLWFTEAGVFAPVPTKIGNLIIGDE
jgi:virginiamycin B lyase